MGSFFYKRNVKKRKSPTKPGTIINTEKLVFSRRTVVHTSYRGCNVQTSPYVLDNYCYNLN